MGRWSGEIEKIIISRQVKNDDRGTGGGSPSREGLTSFWTSPDMTLGGEGEGCRDGPGPPQADIFLDMSYDMRFSRI